jgi:hypothetical protein
MDHVRESVIGDLCVANFVAASETLICRLLVRVRESVICGECVAIFAFALEAHVRESVL